MVLVGFMASGKSTVGRHLARRLGWRCVDADREIEARSGATIPELFRDRGEAWFRRTEAGVVSGLLDLSSAVVVPGGGWAAAPGRLESLPPGTLSVWLKVSPETAVRRSREQGGVRPLLDGTDDPVAAARRLLEERRDAYGKARLHLDTEAGTPDEVAERIEHAVRRAPGAPDAIQ